MGKANKTLLAGVIFTALALLSGIIFIWHWALVGMSEETSTAATLTTAILLLVGIVLILFGGMDE